MDININIKCEDLALSFSALARAIGCLAPTTLRAEKDIDPEALKAAVENAPAQIAPADPAPVNPTPARAAYSPVPAPTAPSPTAVPTSPAPTITGDMVAKAGADLLAQNPAAMPQLMGLLQKYGVGCAQELRPEQIGPFATEMRALGAKI